MSKRFDFDSGEYGADRVEIPVTYKKKNYVLVEATEDIIAKYRRRTKEGSFKLKKGSDTVTVDQEYSGCYLLSMCLYEESDTGRKPVREEIIRQWPRRVTAPLIDEILDIATSFQPVSEEELVARIEADKEKLARMRQKHESNGKKEDESSDEEEVENPAKN